MPTRDIRRQMEDAQAGPAERYVRPGVVNTAVADAIRGVGGSLIEMDAALAGERLGKDLDAARSEFIAGELNDAASGEGGSPLNDPELEAQLEKELAPFKKQLGKMSNAKEQGLLRSDRFRMQADMILQQHIARRPGLAPEFRSLHAQYTGGAVIETLMRREQELYDAALRAAGEQGKDEAEQVEKNRMFQLNAMKEAGFAAEAGSLVYASPEEVNSQFMALYPQISRQERTKHDAATLESAVAGRDAGMALDRPASLQTWQTGYDLALEGVLKTLRESRTMLAGADEQTFAGMMVEWRGALAQVKANLEAKRASLGLKPDDVSAQMATFNSLEESGAKLLDGTLELDERKKRIETWGLRLEAELQQNSPLIASIVELEKRGAHNAVKYMYDQNAQLARNTGQQFMEFVIRGAGDPAVVSPLSGGFSQALLKDMFPEGSLTKNPSVDMPAGMKLLTDFGLAFAMTPSDAFKVKPYADWIEELTAFAEPLKKLSDQQQLGELSESVRISAHKALRVGYLSLLAEHPQLKGNLQWSGEPGNEPFILKDDSDGVLVKVVDRANQQMAYGNVLRLLTRLGTYPDEGAAHKHILQSADELMGQEAKATMARQERDAARAGSGAGGSGGVGRVGPSVGAVEDGYRFLGGDPSQKSSWEKVSD